MRPHFFLVLFVVSSGLVVSLVTLFGGIGSTIGLQILKRQLQLIDLALDLLRRPAEDIRYTLAHWSGLTRFLEDSRLELDTNPVENQIRKIALTRKNALFAGHEAGAENWALLSSLIANCKIGDVDPVRHQALRPDPRPLSLTPKPPAGAPFEYLDLASKAFR